MQIPKEYLDIYNHWGKHSQHQAEKKDDLDLPSVLLWFITERQSIWERKFLNKLKPYTNDPILQKYRFCNIYRELDKQTIDIHSRLNPLRDNFPLWLLNIAMCRFIANIETVDKVGQLSFDSKNDLKVYNALLDLPKPKYGSAYVFPISVIQKSDYRDRESFICKYLPKMIRSIASEITRFDNLTVNSALKIVLYKFGFNFRFHWTEILIDVAYQFPSKINLYKDFYVGPGAIPTAKSINPNVSTSTVVDTCVGNEPDDFPYLTYEGKTVRLSSENWEGIFCEYRKYSNLKKGEGRHRIYR